MNGEACFGYPAPEPTAVVLLSEEPLSASHEGLRAAGLNDASNLHILTSFDARGHQWSEIVTAAVQQAVSVSARALFIDTPGPFAGLEGESENFAGPALAAMTALDEATAAGLSVLMPWHDRKSGGEIGESGRGSSAFAGAVDIILALRKPKGSRDTVRTIQAVGRFRDLPRELTVELIALFPPSTEFGVSGKKAIESFRLLTPGEAADATDEGAATDLLRVMPATAEDAQTADELAAAAEIAVSTVRRLVGQLGFEQVGAGHRGDPRRFYSNHSHQPLRVVGKAETKTQIGKEVDEMAVERGPPVQRPSLVQSEPGVRDNAGD